jgi:signal transduction histidine kinase
MATALDQDLLCVHLLEEAADGTPVLRRTAAVGLPRPLLEITDLLPLGVKGGGAGLAAAEGHAVVIDDLSTYPGPPYYRAAAAASEIRSEWAAPIVGARGVLGTVSGFATSVGRPEPAQLELAGLYLGYAASAIERERLLAEVSRRNRVLESLRAMLESLAGPGGVDGGLGASLLALSGAIGADAVAVFVADSPPPPTPPGDAAQSGSHGRRAGVHPAGSAHDGRLAGPPGAPGATGSAATGEPDPGGADGLRLHATNDHEGEIDTGVVRRLRAAAARVIEHDDDRPAQLIEPDLAAVALRHPEGRAVLAAHLVGDRSPSVDTLELLDDATRSLAPALEAEVLERSHREAAALRRSQAIQRELLSSLSHELRTPLTAIQGFASTLRQHDLTWDAASTERFLGSIATEAARLERLVGDLLDSSAIESGVLRLQRDWCDLRLVVRAAIDVVDRKAPGSAGSTRPAGPVIDLRADPGLETTWGDHDRLEQVFVNLVENAVAHGASGEPIIVTLRRGARPGTVEVGVRDLGPGLPPELGERIFESRVRGTTEAPGAGLGLPIARAIVEAHGGSLRTVPVDRGASFLVTLPAEPPAEPPAGTGAGPGAVNSVPEGSWSVVDETGDGHV